ncbi:Uncharacterized protein dnm_068190 [Desulfonema magnum]|uniref:Uncharacterized protein n=1 Tax=Desulfonema magnum TaxID=45655 RepID=A0A975BSF0_9BACT|nr:Uncharacterized protein dnm_068190 [Desulfonema magnum]
MYRTKKLGDKETRVFPEGESAPSGEKKPGFFPLVGDRETRVFPEGESAPSGEKSRVSSRAATFCPVHRFQL